MKNKIVITLVLVLLVFVDVSDIIVNGLSTFRIAMCILTAIAFVLYVVMLLRERKNNGR